MDDETAAGHARETGRASATAPGPPRPTTPLRVLVAVRSATPLHRLLDALRAFSGDHRVDIRFTLVPGSEFFVGALAALGSAGAEQIPWEEATTDAGWRLVLAASPNGELDRLTAPLVLLPHGAGHNKRGADDLPITSSATRPRRDDGRPLVTLHAVAHPGQRPRPPGLSAVVGDPTLDRMDQSRPRRARYRSALGTGARRLVVLTSTWGPESLLARRPGLPLRLVRELPLDGYQVALVLHPNVYSRRGRTGLRRELEPALHAGLLRPEPYEEWAAVLLAADVVVSDHGSTALYAVAQGVPVINGYEGGAELLPGSPLATLLADAPRLDHHAPYAAQLDAARTDGPCQATGRAVAAAFAARGEALPRLRARLYGLLGIAPPEADPTTDATPFPVPAVRGTGPHATEVWTVSEGDLVRVVRRPPGGDPGDFLAADSDLAAARLLQNAALLHRRGDVPAATLGTPLGPDEVWRAEDWARERLDRYPVCRGVGLVVAEDRCLLWRSGEPAVALRAELSAPQQTGAPLVRHDPVAVLSAVHGWLDAHPGAPRPGRLTCVVAGREATVTLTAATALEVALPVGPP
ncbi:translation initiation factor 2 [Streptomyces otsuchiensis]|uniref:translation initiation factor 2 n=1 Tax=Streptomyces otsuchiensis TaxID=2681388 RepID=UPI001031622F|nr:translation initiation factor 2 [Streptomyces otsuchiensis]